MNQKTEKENVNDIVTELIAKKDQKGSLFLKSVDKNNEVSPIIDKTDRQQPPSKTSNKVYIEKLLRNNNMLVQGSTLGPVYADNYGRIKRPLLSNAFGKSAALVEKGNFILLTSSIPGEGKTYTAINLALSLANERDHTVLLIDCDVIRHGTSSALDITDKPGLTDILENKDLSVGDVILGTDIPELCLISSGGQHVFATELLASQRMVEIMTEISKRYDDRIIIFDGPPLLATPQTQVLCTLVGQVVFVIEAGKTPRTVVEEALGMIPEGQAAGLVMNKYEGIPGRNSYYYGYYDEK